MSPEPTDPRCPPLADPATAPGASDPEVQHVVGADRSPARAPGAPAHAPGSLLDWVLEPLRPKP